MQTAEKSIPIPILCNIVMPDGFLEKALAIGTKMQSYMGMTRIMDRPTKDRSEAVGISKPGKIVLSMLAPCLVKKVEI